MSRNPDSATVRKCSTSLLTFRFALSEPSQSSVSDWVGCGSLARATATVAATFTFAPVTTKRLRGLHWSGERWWRTPQSANGVSAEHTARGGGGHDADSPSLNDDGLDDWYVFFASVEWYYSATVFVSEVALRKATVEIKKLSFFSLFRQSNSTSQFPAHHIISSNCFWHALSHT